MHGWTKVKWPFLALLDNIMPRKQKALRHPRRAAQEDPSDHRRTSPPSLPHPRCLQSTSHISPRGCEDSGGEALLLRSNSPSPPHDLLTGAVQRPTGGYPIWIVDIIGSGVLAAGSAVPRVDLPYHGRWWVLIVKATQGEAGEHRVCRHGIGGADPAQVRVDSDNVCVLVDSGLRWCAHWPAAGMAFHLQWLTAGNGSSCVGRMCWSPDHAAVLGGPADEQWYGPFVQGWGGTCRVKALASASRSRWRRHFECRSLLWKRRWGTSSHPARFFWENSA